MFFELSPEICQQCGKLEELRPYGKKQENGVRLSICYDCGMLDEEEIQIAFSEELDRLFGPEKIDHKKH